MSRNGMGGGAGDVGRTVAQRYERSVVVLAALERLPAEQQEVLRMVYFAGRTQGEVAERLQLPLAQVKARVFAGLRRVGHLLDPEDTA